MTIAIIVREEQPSPIDNELWNTHPPHIHSIIKSLRVSIHLPPFSHLLVNISICNLIMSQNRAPVQ